MPTVLKTRSSAVAVMADCTAYRSYGMAAEPNHRLMKLYTVQKDRWWTHS